MLLTPRQSVSFQAIMPASERDRPTYTISAPSQGLSVAQLLGKFRRGLWLIALMTLVGGILAYGYSLLIPNSYVASAMLAVEAQHFSIPELQGALSGDTGPDPLPEVMTEVQVLTSPRLLLQVINTLHLDRDPEFDPRLHPPSLLNRAATALNVDWIDRSWGFWSDIKRWVGLPPDTEAPEMSQDEVQQAVLGGLSRRLLVSHNDRSLIIGIQCTAENPKIAASVVNTLIEVYEQARFDDHERINKAANASLMRRVDEVHAQAVQLENKVRLARTQNDLPSLDRGNVAEQQLSELISAATKSSVERSQADTIAARARALAQSGATDELASVVGSGTISRLRDQETQASRLVAEGQSRYGENYPALQSAKASLQTVRSQIAIEVRRTVASLDAQATTADLHDQKIQAALSAARASSHQVAGGELEIKQLGEEAAARRKLYESLLQRAEQTQTDPNQQMVTGARVVSSAFAPVGPSGPKRKLATGFGAFGGLVVGCFLSLVRGKRKQRRFVDGSELASVIGLPVLVKLPQLGRLRLSAEGSEAMRLLRSRIRFNGGTSPARTIVFVAAGGRADIAGTSIAFARTAALDGERVLLVEGSVTEPVLAGRLGQDVPAAKRNGLQDLLNGALPLRDAIVTDPLSGLDALLVDKPSPTLLGLVHGTRFQMLLADAVQSYSLIIISAPSSHSSETLALAHAAEATIFVVGSGQVRVASLQSSITGLADSTYGFAAAVLAC